MATNKIDLKNLAHRLTIRGTFVKLSEEFQPVWLEEEGFWDEEDYAPALIAGGGYDEDIRVVIWENLVAQFQMVDGNDILDTRTRQFNTLSELFDVLIEEGITVKEPTK